MSSERHDTRAQKRLVRFEDVGGIHRYEGARQSSKGLWNDTDSVVVFTDSGTRHSREIYVFDVSSGSANPVALPDYVQNALGRVEAARTSHHCVSSPKRWEGNALHLELSFSVHDPARGRVFYSCEVTLDLQPGSTAATLSRVTKPKSDISQ